jgi:hypothetical protein
MGASRRVDDPPHATVCQDGHIEIQDQAGLQAGESQLGENLGSVNLDDLGDRFQLDNDAVLHDQVDVVARSQLLAL